MYALPMTTVMLN